MEIAKSYDKKVKIINSENPIMFHKNKQKAIEAAKGEWILQLDADEEITEELKEEIKDIIGQSQIESDKIGKNNTDSIRLNPISSGSIFVAYWIPRKNFFLTRFLMKGGQYPDYTIRLYRNGYARFPCKDVHENVEIIDRTDESIGYLKNPILHYADPDFSRYLMRWDRYTTLESQRFVGAKCISPEKPSLINYFIIKPIVTFFSMYFRHKGFMDGFPGFVFSFFSGLRFMVIYIKVWTQSHNKEEK